MHQAGSAGGSHVQQARRAGRNASATNQADTYIHTPAGTHWPAAEAAWLPMHRYQVGQIVSSLTVGCHVGCARAGSAAYTHLCIVRGHMAATPALPAGTRPPRTDALAGGGRLPLCDAGAGVVVVGPPFPGVVHLPRLLHWGGGDGGLRSTQTGAQRCCSEAQPCMVGGAEALLWSWSRSVQGANEFVGWSTAPCALA